MSVLLTRLSLIITLLCPNIEVSTSDKVLISEVQFAKGLYTINDQLITGEIIDYYKNETLKFRYRVLEGRLHGKATEFYSSGAVKSEKKYISGKLYGAFKEYFEDGDLRAQFEVGLNAYGAGEKIERLKVAAGNKRKLKSKGEGVIYFIEDREGSKSTSQVISILHQSTYKILDSKGKLLFEN